MTAKTETAGDYIVGKTRASFKLWQPPSFATAMGVQGAGSDISVPGAGSDISVPVAALDVETLDDLAQTWLAALYKKAGQINKWSNER